MLRYPLDKQSNILYDSSGHAELLHPHRDPALGITGHCHAPFDIQIRQHPAALNAGVYRQYRLLPLQGSLAHDDISTIAVICGH